MSSLGLVFLDQLSKNNLVYKNINKDDDLLFFEPMISFYELPHHKQKLIYLITSIRKYIPTLGHKNIIHEKICKDHPGLSIVLKKILAEKPFEKLYVTKPSDYQTLKELMFFCQSNSIALKVLEDTKFISNEDDFDLWSKGKKSLIQEYFYRWIRKKHSVLMDNGKPEGGKWNLDKENRKGASALKEVIPERSSVKTDEVTIGVMVEVDKIFNDSFGDIENFNWATTHEEAWSQMLEFFNTYFKNYGSFQDAMKANEPFMFHSLLSAYLNSGLLDPMDCIKEAENRYRNNEAPLNSAEGFIRQIIGWREFIRGVYVCKGSEERTKNYWNFDRKIPKSFYNGSTGIDPIDDTIKKVNKSGYANHIERLMILGNFMVLCEFDPNEVYKWFMELFVDSYDWVMVPNVYGMSQFADGGLMSTKPYISSSNYIIKMSDYKKGSWSEIWDGLFWTFMDKQREFFKKNPRMRMLISSYDKMDLLKKEKLLLDADNFIKNL